MKIYKAKNTYRHIWSVRNTSFNTGSISMLSLVESLEKAHVKHAQRVKRNSLPARLSSAVGTSIPPNLCYEAVHE
jgi:hypothetical protein